MQPSVVIEGTLKVHLDFKLMIDQKSRVGNMRRAPGEHAPFALRYGRHKGGRSKKNG